MTRHTPRVFLVLLSLLMHASVFGQARLIRAHDPVPDEYIVVLADDVLPEQVADVARDLTFGEDVVVEKIWSDGARAFLARMKEGRALALSNNRRVKFVEENGFWSFSSELQQTNLDPRSCTPTCNTVSDNRLWHLDVLDQNSPGWMLVRRQAPAVHTLIRLRRTAQRSHTK